MSLDVGPESANSVFPGGPPPLKSAWSDEKEVDIAQKVEESTSAKASLWPKVRRFVANNFIWISLINLVEIIVIAGIVTG